MNKKQTNEQLASCLIYSQP